MALMSSPSRRMSVTCLAGQDIATETQDFHRAELPALDEAMFGTQSRVRLGDTGRMRRDNETTEKTSPRLASDNSSATMRAPNEVRRAMRKVTVLAGVFYFFLALFPFR